MDVEYRLCIDCKQPVPASSFHEHLKSKQHRANKMASRMNCGVRMGGLPMAVTKEILMDVLQNYGQVRSCSINPQKRTAIAEFEYSQAAEAFLKSPVLIFNQMIDTAPRVEAMPRRIVSPERGVDDAAIIAAIETASQSPTTNIEEHIGIVLDFILLRDPARDDKLAVIVEDLEQHLARLLPDCRAELLGSAVTELSLPGDAIDISLCDGPSCRSVSLLRNAECAIGVHNALMNCQHKFASIEVPDTRHPMIRFVHNSTRIACNVVINDIEGPRSTRRLRWVLELDERIRLVTVFVKYWAKTLKLINNAKLSGYAMTLLVFFYLQQASEAMIPALRLLHDTNIPEMSRNITNRDPLRVLIEGFFSYYADVPLRNLVLSLHLGEVMDRVTFLLKGAMPPEMKMYTKILDSGSGPLRVDTPMVLQDPYDLSLNVTSHVDVHTVAEFQSCCKIAHEMILSRNLLHLLKAHCAPAASAQFTAEINTTFRAARFLQPNYLVPEPKNEVVLTKQELFQRWLNVMFVILPDFLINFVRLQVEPQDVPIEQTDWEPRAKVAKLSGMASASKSNAAGKTASDEGMTRRWLCRGRPVICSWQQRKKAAAELELGPSVHPMEREVLISKHLEQKYQRDDVCFFFVLKVDEEKEMVRCFFENRDVKPEPFSTVAHALVTLLPLWINNAFEVGFSLRCVTGVYIPGDMHIGGS